MISQAASKTPEAIVVVVVVVVVVAAAAASATTIALATIESKHQYSSIWNDLAPLTLQIGCTYASF